MKLSKLAALATTTTLAFGAALPSAALAQDAGATVYSQIDDSTVGTIESNDGATAILDTGAYKAPLPVATYAMRDGKWTINATTPQIDGMMAAAEAEAAKKLAAALVEGAAVVSADNRPAGTILAIDTAMDQVIVENEMGIVSLKQEHFAVNQAGALTALFTGEQIAGFTTEVPEGAEIRTASGTLIRAADGSDADGEMSAS